MRLPSQLLVAEVLSVFWLVTGSGTASAQNGPSRIDAPVSPSSSQNHLGTGGLLRVNSQVSVPSEEELAKRRSSWQAHLTSFSASENIPIFFDVDLSTPLPLLPESIPKGMLALKVLAYATHRRLLFVDGVAVYVRTPSPDDNTAFPKGITRVTEWLTALAPAELSALSTGHMPLSEAPPLVQDSIIRTALHVVPSLAAVVLQRGSQAGMVLRFRPLIEWQEPGTRQTITYPVLTDIPNSVIPSDKVNHTPWPGSIPIVGVRPQSNADARLSIDDGALLSLDQLLSRASGAFNVRYSSDARVGGSYYFVRGRFTKRTLGRILSLATPIPPASEWGNVMSMNSESVRAFLSGKASGLLHRSIVFSAPPGVRAPINTPGEAFITGLVMPLSSLLGDNVGAIRWFTQQLGSRGLTADTAVTLRPSLELDVDWGGVPLPGTLFGNNFPVFIE